jgi:ubiquinone biosynthesis protein UbiJ
VLIEPLENLLNRNLSRSPAARQLCASLRDAALGIHIEDIEQYILVQSLGSSLKLTQGRPAERSSLGETAVEISGSPINLGAMLMSDSQSTNRQRLLNTRVVQIQGNAAILEQYQQLLQLLRPELPEELESLLGDTTIGRTVAHQAGQWLQSLLHFGRHATQTASLNLAEYFAHERGDLVPRAEAEQFLSAVDQVRERADRLQARLQNLTESMIPAEDKAP